MTDPLYITNKQKNVSVKSHYVTMQCNLGKKACENLQRGNLTSHCTAVCKIVCGHDVTPCEFTRCIVM